MRTTKNLQSLEKLEGICTGLGEDYKPGQQKLQVEAMTTLLSQAQTLVNAADDAHIVHERTTNQRRVLFSDLGKLGRRLLNALIVSGATPQNVEDARSLVRQLSGPQAMNRAPVVASTATTTTDLPAATKRSVRGRDFASTERCFRLLIETLAAEPNYQPRETALQVATLKNQLAALKESNSAVIKSAEALRQARNDRDAVLYKQDNSVYRVGQLAKVYVKSVFGYNSESHIAVRKLPFTSKPA